ncbi:MAG: hypothetical protein COX77_00405 [Candidatus Komeilibacteria bacterium CG_4_10_14_0_2_um_filter_37_10]|uniref:General secretion pathway GspH domain-containing protein n=1 Tax=Candidatus Komeilibacteria bacterium CG_4_10_14_0_2_um_filter_37_10 TaxID=1974470 RepID=A0A2M7VGJ9_9BACT|nr:MAG: hypothetical protein COX77_00405 [Candidatus Komeilibacteria bacterium CG_4_10_14_0_2_um_filter_37_10]PJA92465.1 MAG: hypothetical protein CO133_03070 [Candidatus Komeilibacteria bacterium CG_4_9_14_3_um_filter_37_5]
MQKILRAGFTYTELLIVMGIFIATMAIALPFLSQFLAINKSDTSLTDVCQNLKRTQFKAMAGLRGTKWGAYFSGNNYITFSGNSYGERQSNEDENYSLPNGYLFTNDLNNEIVFDRLTGKPNKGGVVSLQINGYERRDCIITVNGLISF